MNTIIELVITIGLSCLIGWAFDINPFYLIAVIALLKAIEARNG
jgi:hypothetical protein